MRISISVLLFCLFSAPVFSAGPAEEISAPGNQTDHFSHQQILLAGASQEKKSEPESGSLIIPGESQGKEKKKCLNVCKKWGEDCIINPRTGSRDCRRTCKQFGEECF
jgi:hypothetical protein